MAGHVTRRGFLKGTIATAGITVLSGSWAAKTYAANSKLRMANVGVGGRGGAHLGWGEQVALCDTNRGTLEKVGAKFPGAKKFDDWRKMFDEVAKEIDAVAVGTPDHTHFPVSYTAVKLGKHVYCEKPLTHSIWEARTLAEATRQAKVATQMGNQGHANQGNRRVVEWVQAGILGEIKEVHTWTNRPVWPQGIDRPSGSDAVPSHLNWDAWLGVAPERPYVGGKTYEPFVWRGWCDFGCGAIGDMGCHTWDCVWWSMEPGAPLSCEPVKIVGKKEETFPKQMSVKWEFGPAAKRPGFVAFWYEGGLKPDVPDEIKNDPDRTAKKMKGGLPGSGSLFIGTKGKMLVEGDYGDSPSLVPLKAMSDLKAAGLPPKMEASPGHSKEFIMAASGEKPWDFPKSNFMYGGPLVEAMNLGNVAMRLGRKVSWDPVNLKCPGTPEADPLIRREYRSSFWKVI